MSAREVPLAAEEIGKGLSSGALTEGVGVPTAVPPLKARVEKAAVASVAPKAVSSKGRRRDGDER